MMLRSVSHIRNRYTLASSPRLTLNKKELVEKIVLDTSWSSMGVILSES